MTNAISSDLRKDCPMRHPDNGNCTVAGGFCTAVNDPICEALHNAYHSGFHDCTVEVLRDKRELKPCPFCGGVAEVSMDEDWYYEWTVCCLNDSRHSLRYFNSEEEAVEAWNRRA